METILTLAFAILVPNLLGFALMGIDKKKAKQGAFRVPESVLFTMALIGGSIGSLAGMFVFHHKTKKLHFLIGMPLILAVQLLLVFLLWRSPLQFRFL